MRWRHLLPLAGLAVLIASAPQSLVAQGQLPRPAQLPPAGGPASAAPSVPLQRAPSNAGQPAGPGQAAQAAQADPQLAPPKPYKPVQVTLPPPSTDASFETFRKRLGEIAARKDRAALAALVAPNFFRMNAEGKDGTEKGKSGIDNLAAVIELDAADGSGWDVLVGASHESTLQPFQGRQGVMCAPAPPKFDESAFEQLVKSTGTSELEWSYPGAPPVQVRGSKAPDGPVTEQLGAILVRIMPEMDGAGGEPDPNAPLAVRVVTPSGKTGYVSGDALLPLVFDQFCFVKQGNEWKIAGFVGGD